MFPSFVFFGTDSFATHVLETLKEKGALPDLVVTTPDSPKGRKLILSPPEVKVWANKNNVPHIQPPKLKDPEVLKKLSQTGELFVVASYGKIIPKEVLDITPREIVNIHPSLLPELRGPSPIHTALLEKEGTGVSIMLIDEDVDHGPILTQKNISFSDWPLPRPEAEKTLAKEGAELLFSSVPQWIQGDLNPQEQNHTQATHTKKIEKKDGHISLEDSAEKNYKKYCAFYGWPGVFFFIQKKDRDIRVQITEAHKDKDEFVITKVIPEGKKEMSYTSFLNGLQG